MPIQVHLLVWTVVVLTRIVCLKVSLSLAAFDLVDVLILGSALILSRSAVRVRYPLFYPAFAVFEALALVSYVGLYTMPLTYAVQKFDNPLQDAALLAFDRAVGFDYVAFMVWATGYPRTYEVLGRIYQHFQYVALAVFACGMLFQRGRGAGPRFFASFVIALLVAALVSAFFPAFGAAILLDPDLGAGAVGATPVDDIDALRAGRMREMPVRAGGLISFPSLHVGLGLLILHHLRGSWLLPVFAPHALLFMLTALTHGGHYLADCLAALPLAAASVWLAGALLRGGRDPARERPAAAGGAAGWVPAAAPPMS